MKYLLECFNTFCKKLFLQVVYNGFILLKVALIISGVAFAINGISNFYWLKYQLATALTKNTPDKNLQVSFQLIFFIFCC
jgi:hypothetical protein